MRRNSHPESPEKKLISTSIMLKVIALVGVIAASSQHAEAATSSEEVGTGECFLRTSRQTEKGIEANFQDGDKVPYSSRKVGYFE